MDDDTEQEVDGWTAICVDRCVDFADQLISRHQVDPANIHVEQTLDMRSIGLRTGKADLILVVPPLVIIVDWKLGFLDQGEADVHEQTPAYAAAACEQFGCTQALVYLYQPRQPKDLRASSASYSAETLALCRRWVAAVAHAAREPNPPICAAYRQCANCRALVRCPAATEYIMNVASALELIGTPLGPEGLGQLADAAKLAEKFAKEGKAIVKAAMHDGQAADGWQLGAPQQIRFVTEVDSALVRLDSRGFPACALARVGAIKLSLPNLPDGAEEVIQDLIGEKAKEQSLIPERRAKPTSTKGTK